MDLLKASINIFKHISNIQNFSSLLNDGNMHCHEIENATIKLVSRILKEYGFNDEKISNIFEDKVYQVKISNKSRMVFYLIDVNIIVPLFVDTNHQVYCNSSYDTNCANNKFSLYINKEHYFNCSLLF